MEEKEIHLRDYLSTLNKRKTTVFTIFFLVFILAVIRTYTATPMYRAATKVMIEKNAGGDLASAYRYSGYDPEFLETQYQLIKSAAVVKKVVKKLGPDQVYDALFEKESNENGYDFFADAKKWLKDLLASLKHMMGIEELRPSDKGSFSPKQYAVPLTKAEQIENLIKGGLQTQPVANSRVVEISFWSDNPAVAMRVVNSVANAYINELLDMQMEMTGNSISWMKEKSDLQRQKLEESEKALHEYKKKYDIVTIENRLAVLPERLSELSRSLTAAETRRKELSAEYNQVKNTDPDLLETIPAIGDNSSIEAINQKVLMAEQKISELSKKYGYKHPKMISAKNELNSLKAKKKTELAKAVETVRSEYQLARSKEQDLKTRLEQSKFQAAQVGEQSIQLGILQRKVDTNRYLYDALIKSMKEKGITEKSQSVNVWVIEKAQLPGFPSKPRTQRDILLGVVIGLFCGIGLAFFLEYFDNTVKTPEDIEEKFDIPVIAAIDLHKDKKTTLLENILNEPSSLGAETFKGLRTSVFLSSADRPPKSLLVTSMIPGEGKSSISACLSISIARAEKKVLLIDSDMRRPSQHKHFDVKNDTGLSSVLAGLSSPELQSPIQELSKTFFFLPSGPVPPNPSELLSSEKFKQLVTAFSKKFDMIIFDAPPMASVTDPIILSQNSDATIIVSWTGKVTYDMLNKGLKQLETASAPVAGIVLNRFSARKTGYYYNYGDYYYSSDA